MLLMSETPSPEALRTLFTIAWALSLLAAILVYRNASKRRARLGQAPAALAPAFWAVVVFLLGVLGLLFYGIAVLGQDRGGGQR
jgi:hypothetical protein